MNITLRERAGVYTVDSTLGVRFKFTKVREDRDGTHAEVLVSAQDGFLLRSRLNLTSARSRRDLAKVLAERWPLPDETWEALVESACEGVLARFRAPARALTLAEVPLSPLTYLVPPLIVSGEPNVLVGPGGVGKSYLALALALAVAAGGSLGPFTPGEKGTVLYLDWEASAAELRRRADRLLRPLGRRVDDLPLFLRPCALPLAHDEGLAELVAELSPTLLVLDSLGLAAGGDLTEASSATTFFAALRRLATTALVVAHTPKHELGPATIFGSVYYMNLARNVWEVRSSPEPGGLALALFHRKCNLGPLQEPLALSLTFTEDGVTLARRELPPEFEDRLPLPERVLRALRESPEPLRPRDLAALLGEPYPAVAQALHRLARKGLAQELGRGLYAAGEDIPF